MASTNLYQGEDKKVNVRVKNSAGVYQSIDALVDYIVWVYSQKGTSILRKWNKAGGGGYTALTKDTTTTYYFILDNLVTKQYPAKDIIIELIVIETDAEFPNSEKISKTKTTLFDVEEAQSKDES